MNYTPLNDTVNLEIHRQSDNETSSLRIVYRSEGYFELHPNPGTLSNLYMIFPKINGTDTRIFVEPSDFVIILRNVWRENFEKAIINICGGLLFIDQDEFYSFLCSILNEVRSSNELVQRLRNANHS